MRVLIPRLVRCSLSVTADPDPRIEKSATWTISQEQGDEATAGVDFNGISGTVTIAPNTSTSVIEIDILGDNVPEANETFTITLSNPSFKAEIQSGTNKAKGTITNDDGTGLRVEAANLTEGDSGPSDMIFTVTVIPPTK